MAANSILPVSLAESPLLSPATGGGNGKPTNAKEAATQFEGMLIGEMLRSVHDSNSGSLDGDEDSDSESDTTYSMAADQFAQIMAKQGGFGVAKLLTQGLTTRDSGGANAKSGDGHLDGGNFGKAKAPLKPL
jgi:Rod binding domain-containing protein